MGETESTPQTRVVRACGVGDLPDGGSLRLDSDPPIAIFRSGDEFFATADSCTHEEWSLGEEGEVDGFEVTCTLHMATFDVRNGRPLCLPATIGLRTYAVEVMDGDVVVHLT